MLRRTVPKEACLPRFLQALQSGDFEQRWVGLRLIRSSNDKPFRILLPSTSGVKLRPRAQRLDGRSCE